MLARVASSFIGFEQAWQNLKEVEDKEFETVKQEGREAWNKVLGRIEVEGGDLDKKTYVLLYTLPLNIIPQKVL